MRKTTKTFSVLMMAAFMAVSCGDNKSGGGVSSNTNPGVTSFNNGVPTGTGTSYNTIEEVRTMFGQSSFASGVTTSTEIIHAGSMYQSGGYSDGGLDLGIIQLNFNFNFNMGGNNQADQMRVLRVNSASESSVNVTRATDAQYNPYTGQIDYDYTGGETSTLSRDGNDYKDMLLLDNPQCAYVEVTTVTIHAQVFVPQTNGQNQQNQQLNLAGNKISCYTYGGYGREYIVTNALPVAANPVKTIENGQMGYLVNVGNTYITGVSEQ